MSMDEDGKENGDLQFDIEGNMIQLLLLHHGFSGSNVVNRLTCLLFNFLNALAETKTGPQSEGPRFKIQDCGWETYWGKKGEIHIYSLFYK